MARAFAKRSATPFLVSLRMAGVLLGIELIDLLLPLGLDRFGIRPREWIGLEGVVFAPLLHRGFGHVVSNIGPLLALMPLLLVDQRQRPWMVLGFIWIMGGLGTWLLGRGGAIHIGASGVVYGIAAYLVFAGIFGSSWKATLIAIVVVLVYGGMVHGLLPQAGPVSWEGHLVGAVSGAVAAWRNRSRIKSKPLIS
jgi:membrane associated rhomboid family serine protease